MFCGRDYAPCIIAEPHFYVERAKSPLKLPSSVNEQPICTCSVASKNKETLGPKSVRWALRKKLVKKLYFQC